MPSSQLLRLRHLAGITKSPFAPSNTFGVSNMNRLFMLRDIKGQPFIQIPQANGPLCFPNKKEAKARRDEVNATDLGYHLHVSYGPDHSKFGNRE
jgi:hypothetical protein